eukprot:m.162150 g.162150  ORF g.162150 m.162150 type:complete len:1302 (-) comp13404_c0_seq15:1782-5687(-)
MSDYFLDDASTTEDESGSGTKKKRENTHNIDLHVKETSDLHQRQQDYLDQLGREVDVRPQSADSQSSYSSIASSIKRSGNQRRGGGRPPSGKVHRRFRGDTSSVRNGDGGGGRSRRTRSGRVATKLSRSPYAAPVHRLRPDTASSTRSGRSSSVTSSSRGTSRSSSRSRRSSTTNSRSSSVTSRTSSVVTTQSVMDRLRSGPKVYFQRPHTSRLIVFRNGTCANSVRVVANTLHGILENATKKLKLPFAARRLFDEYGTEYKNDSHCTNLEQDQHVYVSLGEPYIDAVAQAAKGNTLTPSKSRTKRQRTTRSEQVDSTRAFRVACFLNGDGLNMQYIPLTTSSVKFFDACTSKFVSSSSIMAMFTIDGKRITDINRVKPCDPCLEVVLGRCLGPVWVATKTESFKPGGVKLFLSRNLNHLKRAKLLQSSNASREDNDNSEGDEDMDSNGGDLLCTTIKYIKDKKNEMDGMDDGSRSRIPAMREDHRLNSIGSKKFVLFHNGQDVNEAGVVVYYNMRLPGLYEMKTLLNTCGRALGMIKPPRKIFLQDGTKVRDVASIAERKDDTREMKLILSQGEPFIHKGMIIAQMAVDDIDIVQPLNREPVFVERAPGLLEDLRSSLLLLYEHRGDILVNHEDLTVDKRSLNVSDKELDMSFPICCYMSHDIPAPRLARPKLVTVDRPKQSQAYQRWIVGRVAESDAEVLGVDPTVSWVMIGSKYIKSLCLAAYPLLRKQTEAFEKRSSDNDTPQHNSNEDEYNGDSERQAEKKQQQQQQGEDFQDDPQNTLENEDNDVVNHYEQDEQCAVVSFSVKKQLSINSLWQFCVDGTVQNAAFPGLCLTLNTPQEPHNPTNTPEDGDDDVLDENVDHENDASLAHPFVLKPFSEDRSEQRRQQWGLFHEDLRFMGQWKLCKDVNASSFWNKHNFVWPTTNIGVANTELAWPLEVVLVAQVPWKPTAQLGLQEEQDGVGDANSGQQLSMSGEMKSMTIRTSRESTTEYVKSQSSSAVPRIIAIRNGSNVSRGVEVLLPISRTVITHGPSDPEKSFTKDTQRWFQQRLGPKWKSVLKKREAKNAKAIVQVRKEQMNMLLDSCTRALGMSVAARRLFTEQGVLIHNIENIYPNQTVIVTATEDWKPSKQLFSRLSRIENGIESLKEVTETLEAVSSSPMVVVYDHRQGILKTRLSFDVGLNAINESDRSQMEERCASIEDENLLVTGWCLSEERWLMPIGGSSKCLAPQSLSDGSELILEDFDSEDARQKWVVSDGFIECVMDPSLVIGLQQISGQHTQVVLQKLQPTLSMRTNAL